MAAACWAEGGHSALVDQGVVSSASQSQEVVISHGLQRCQNGGLTCAQWCSLGRPDLAREISQSHDRKMGGSSGAGGSCDHKGLDLPQEGVSVALALSWLVWNCPDLSQNLKEDRGRGRQNLFFRQQNSQSAVSVVCSRLVPLRFCWVKVFNCWIGFVTRRKKIVTKTV